MDAGDGPILLYGGAGGAGGVDGVGAGGVVAFCNNGHRRTALGVWERKKPRE